MKTETKVMLSVGLISILVLVAGSFWYTNTQVKPQVIDTNNPALLGEGKRIKKANQEKVTVVEFADFECPACKAIAPYLKDLENQYKENVSFVFRTFPIHSNSILATRAAGIVSSLTGKPDDFFAYGDILFENQKEWETAGGAKNQKELFLKYAKSFGVDENKFKTMLDSDIGTDEVLKDQKDARTLGVDSTPSFFVNGKLVRGADYNTLKKFIEEELKK